MSAPLIIAFLMTLSDAPAQWPAVRQLTTASQGHILANRNCWSPDSRWIYHDLRRDETVFDGTRIERVNVETADVKVFLENKSGPFVGVPTTNRLDDRIVVLRAPVRPDENWSYAAWHRCGLINSVAEQRVFSTLDARKVSEPFLPGALRGGTHLHMLNPVEGLVSSTYEDHVLAITNDRTAEANRRVVAVTNLFHSVAFGDEPTPASPAQGNRDQWGKWTVVVTDVVDAPAAGTDEISRAFSDAWVGDSRSIAFLGLVNAGNGQQVSELFVVDLPESLTAEGVRPLQGTATTRPGVPAGTSQRRLTYTTDDQFPGMASPRHWPVATPNGDKIGFYKKADDGRVRFCAIDSRGGEIEEVTDGKYEPTSSFTWNADGTAVSFIADGSVFYVDFETGQMTRLTEKSTPGPRHHACVFSPDGQQIAFMSQVADGSNTFDQIFVVEVPQELQ